MYSGRSHIPLTSILVLSLVMAVSTLTACSTANQDSALSLVDQSGSHPAGWLEGHGGWAEPDGNLCTSCHGSDLSGGISQVSCFTSDFNGQACHAGGPAFHPADWLNKAFRGDPAIWHADAYLTGTTVNGLDCSDCHTPPDLGSWPDGKCVQCHFTLFGARQPVGDPWNHDVDGRNGHDAFTSPEADVCVRCHEANNRFGAEPFCHNCHGSGGHPEADWALASVHGVAARSNPGAMTGFFTCQSCHGFDFRGDAAQSCYGSGCHSISQGPHRNSWRGAHDSTDRDNAPVCGLCHLNDQRRTDPLPDYPAGTGCFNDSLCHGVED